MKTRFLSLAAVGTAVLVFAGWSYFSQPLTFESSSKIWVEGTSTVTDWTCEADRFTGAVTGEIADGALTGLTATTVAIPLAGMDCGGRQITGKMRESLNSSAHPEIRFALGNARVGAPNNGRFAVETTGRLTIAGVTRDIRFTAQGEMLSDGRYRLTAGVPIVMSQFGVDPPRAMLGTLRTGDEVTVRFDVIIRA